MRVPLSEYIRKQIEPSDLKVYSIVAYSFDSVLDLDLEGLVREFRWDRKTDKLQLSYTQKIKGSNYEPFFKYRILLHKFDPKQDILLRAEKERHREPLIELELILEGAQKMERWTMVKMKEKGFASIEELEAEVDRLRGIVLDPNLEIEEEVMSKEEAYRVFERHYQALRVPISPPSKNYDREI